MIISDEYDAQKIKDPPVATPTVRCPERAASRRRPFSPLPDYETSQALAFRDFNESQVTLYKPPPRRRIFDSRLWRAAITALVVYIFLTLVIGIPIIIHQKQHDGPKYPYSPLSYASWPPKNPDFYPGNDKNTTNPIQPGASLICDDWTIVDGFNGSTFIVTTEHYVSPNGQFNFASNASCSGDLSNAQGALYVGINPNQTVQGAVLSVVMQASSLNQSSLCIAVAENFTDLLLDLPDDPSSATEVLYNITLLFPQSATPSQVDSFTTVLPMFDQHFGFFNGNVTFGKVSIAGAASRVTVDSIQADRLLIDTSLEPVAGTFSVNTSLLISTILAPININVSLFNDPDSQFPTTLDVHTGNSNLTANVSVLSPNKGPPLRPNFVANLRTFSGSLSTNFSHDPSSPPTAIQLHAFNDLGPANATLDSLFGGIFQASTKQAAVTVTQGNENGTDPWAQGQPRTMQMDVNVSTRSYGWIGWGTMETPNTYQQGEVVVQSSLADVALSFLG